MEMETQEPAQGKGGAAKALEELNAVVRNLHKICNPCEPSSLGSATLAGIACFLRHGHKVSVMQEEYVPEMN